MAETRYRSIEEVAQQLGVQVKKVQEYLREGRLKGEKNPVSGSWLRVKESDLAEFITGKAVEQPNDMASEKVESNPELAKIHGEIEIAKAKKDLELATRGFNSFEEFDKLKAVLETQQQELSEREQTCVAKEQSVATRERAVAVLEERALFADEERKKMLVDAQNRIAKVGDEYKKRWEAEDEKRRQNSKKVLSHLDRLAELVYNPPPQSLSNRLQEQLIALLAIIMEVHGLHPQFDSRDVYIPLESRYGTAGEQPKRETRMTAEVAVDGSVPANMRACYKACVNVYRWMRQEPSYGHDFCRQILPMARWLQQYVRAKSDDQIADKEMTILALFQKFHRAIMLWAETYQNARDGDWSEAVNWLCGRAQLLEAKLGVGVAQEDANLPLRLQ